LNVKNQALHKITVYVIHYCT